MTESKCFMTRLVRQVFPDPELPAMIALTGQRKRMSQAIIDYKTKGLVARLSSHTRLSMHTKPFRMTSKPDLTPLADRPLFNTWKPFNKYLSGVYAIARVNICSYPRKRRVIAPSTGSIGWGRAAIFAEPPPREEPDSGRFLLLLLYLRRRRKGHGSKT